MNTAEISICIPTYNGRDHIEECLISIANQETNAQIEVIISDDGSQDETVTLIRRTTSLYPRIKWVVLERDLRKGMGENWNTTIQTATAPLIKIMGQDDILLPQCLKREAIPFQDKNISLVWSPRILQIHRMRIATRPKLRPGVYSNADIITDVVKKGRNPIGEPVTGMFRRDTVSQGNIFNPNLKYWIDLDFWLKTLGKGQGQSLPTHNSIFRIHSRSVSKSTQNLSRQEYLYILNQHANKGPSPYALFYVGASAFARRWIYQTVGLLRNKGEK
jgi:glycosyltransferase involved in cell wall biosynthesis